jgi:hypothetical protein
MRLPVSPPRITVAGLLYRYNWARWLLVVWMAFHIVLSALHSLAEVLIHCVLFTAILYLLFRRQSEPYFALERVHYPSYRGTWPGAPGGYGVSLTCGLTTT